MKIFSDFKLEENQYSYDKLDNVLTESFDCNIRDMYHRIHIHKENALMIMNEGIQLNNIQVMHESTVDFTQHLRDEVVELQKFAVNTHDTISSCVSRMYEEKGSNILDTGNANIFENKILNDVPIYNVLDIKPTYSPVFHYLHKYFGPVFAGSETLALLNELNDEFPSNLVRGSALGLEENRLYDNDEFMKLLISHTTPMDTEVPDVNASSLLKDLEAVQTTIHDDYTKLESLFSQILFNFDKILKVSYSQSDNGQFYINRTDLISEGETSTEVSEESYELTQTYILALEHFMLDTCVIYQMVFTHKLNALKNMYETYLNELYKIFQGVNDHIYETYEGGER